MLVKFKHFFITILLVSHCHTCWVKINVLEVAFDDAMITINLK